MQKTIIKLSVYILAVAGLHLLAAQLAGGYFDAFYLRFTNGSSQAMILGSSRAAQGLQPGIINRGLADEGFIPVSNFAFTLANSPYGKTYYEAIERKLDRQPQDQAKQLFLLEVNPWSIGQVQGKTAQEFREVELVLGKVKSVAHQGRPNYEYLIQHYPYSWGKILLDPFQKKEMLLHEDGWLEINIPMDSLSIATRTQSKLTQYRDDVLPSYVPSAERIAYLRKTIELLQIHGAVYLLRLPVHPSMLAIENDYQSDFDELMCQLADDQGIVYWRSNAIEGEYQFTDGNHLSKVAGAAYSERLVERILKEEKSHCD